MNRIIKYATAVKQIELLYSRTTSTAITPLEAYEVIKQPEDTEQRTKRRLRDWLTDLRKHDLVETNQARRDGQRVLERIILTTKGKNALGRVEHPSYKNETQDRVIDLDKVKAFKRSFEKTNPDWEIDVIIRMKHQ